MNEMEDCKHGNLKMLCQDSVCRMQTRLGIKNGDPQCKHGNRFGMCQATECLREAREEAGRVSDAYWADVRKDMEEKKPLTITISRELTEEEIPFVSELATKLEGKKKEGGDMNIKKVQALKEQAELEISRLLREFQNSTGLKITSIYFSSTGVLDEDVDDGRPQSPGRTVRLAVKL